MKKMKESGKLDINKRLTNHSARQYLLQKLRENNVEGTDIMQISGHNNVASINSARNGGKDSLKLVFHSISQPRQINSIFTINRPILYISFTTIYKLLVGKFC